MPADERSFRMRVSEMGGSASFGVESDFSDVRIGGYASDTGKYLMMLADAVRHPRHGMRSFDGRRFSAMDRFEDIDSEDPLALQRLIEQSAFGADHPYARSIYGTTASLDSIELQEMMEHQQVVFVPTGATLLIVGDVRPDQVLAEVRKWFGNWQGYKDLDPMPAVPPPALPGDKHEVSFVPRPGSSTLLTCALRPLPEVRGSDPVLRVLMGVLGEGFGSRLGMALREENGLTYGANAEIVRRRQASALIACSSLQGEKGELGLRLFRGVFDGMRTHPPTEEEVRRAKALRLAEIDSSWDDVLSSTHTWMEALTLGNGTPRLEQERAELERVTVKDVQKLARTLFGKRPVRWVVAGDKALAAKAVEASGFGKLQPYVPRG
jgi:predicted Zn-dependent peptidase